MKKTIKFLTETTSTVKRTGYQGFDDLNTTILWRVFDPC